MYAKADVSNQSHHHQFLKNKVMKANEAPERIFLEWYRIGDKKYRDWCIIPKTNDESVEYTKTDAFIDKATEWLKKNADNYTWYNEMEGESGMIDEFIDDFKEYLKK